MLLHLTACLIINILSYYIAASAPVDIDPNSVKNISFTLNLPNNDSVVVDLSFRMLTYSHLKPSNTFNTTEENVTIKASIPEPNFVSVGDFIEKFRQNLIKKEEEIGGIIESPLVFYRHFKLVGNDLKTALNLRCSYDSTYERRILQIDCLQFQETANERFLSNGEIETFDPNAPYSNSEIINISDLKQTFKMEIS